jgi:hypothetical protein
MALLALVLAGAAQELVPVEVLGIGIDRTAAIESGKRAAVEQALGVALSSETQVQNLRVISDIISSRAAGYIKEFSIVPGSERQLPDKSYQLRLQASVSKSPLVADARTLQSGLGGFRIMVFYDFRRVGADSSDYQYAYDRACEYLSTKGLRYVERSVFDRLREEARALFTERDSAVSVAQNLAFAAGVPVFWELAPVELESREMGVGGIVAAQATVGLKAYDTYTAEGMGSAIANGEPAAGYSGASAGRSAVEAGVLGAADKLLFQMNRYLGDWMLNGKPYLLRFYGVSSYKALRGLKEQLKKDARFGGQMEVVSAKNYSQFDITFKGSADDLADAVLDYAEAESGLGGLDVVGFYKNQVNFALPGVEVPLEERGVLAVPTKK